MDIHDLLAKRSATLISADAEAVGPATGRAMLNRLIAASYPTFEGVRDHILNRRAIFISGAHKPLLAALARDGLILPSAERWVPADSAAKRFLAGGWLEEYLALAVGEVGADEVFAGQRLLRKFGDYHGENEVDVLARFSERLFFCSCKALKSRLGPEDSRTRQSLMDALHEADNLSDHFATSNAMVALAVTTDLFDERTRGVRYEQLHGKASALGVNLITGETLAWPNLIKRLRKIVDSRG